MRQRILWLVWGMAVVMAAALSGCRAAPPPTSPPPTARPLLPTATPTVAASPTPRPTLTASAASPSPTAAARHTPTAAATAAAATPTSSPTHVVRFVPTPTPEVVASPTATVAVAPTPAVRPTAARAAPVADRTWDPRLTQRGAQLIPAEPRPGQGYWRLVEARWFDVNDAPFVGKHHIFVDTRDAAGNRRTGVRIQMTSLDQKEDYGSVITEAKPGEPYAANFAMYIVAPAYRVAPADGAPADAVTGLGLGSIAVPDLPTLTSYGFTWQWTDKP